MEPEHERFAELLAASLATDIAEHPPAGALVRVIVRWFDEGDPLYFTAHALGTEEQHEIDGAEAWYPLEWPNVDRELERADRVRTNDALQRAGELISDDGEGDFSGEDDVDELAPAVIVEVVRRLPGALTAAGVPLARTVAITAQHFEGYGARAVLDATADRSILASLDRDGLLPDE